MALYFGIERTNRAWRVAAIRVSYGKHAVERVWSVPLKSVEEDEQKTSELLGVVGPSDAVAVALPGRLATTKRLTMPLGVQKQLKEALPFELEASLPFELEGHVWDSQQLRSDADGIRMFVAIAREEDVRGVMSATEDLVGAEPERVSLGASSLVHVIKSPGISRALVYLTEDTAELVVVAEGRCAHYAHLGNDAAGWPRAVRVSLAAYVASGMAAPLSLSVLSDDVHDDVYVAELAAAFGQAAGIAIEEVAALDVAVLPTVDATTRADLVHYAVPVGLAMGLAEAGRGVDFRQGALRYERGFGWLGSKLPDLVPLMAVAALALLVSSVAHGFAASKERDARRATLSAETQAVFNDETTDPEAARALVAAVGAKMAEDPMPHADAFDLMVRISEVLPEGVKMDLEELDLKKGHVGFTGIVDSVSDAEAFARNLGAQPCFHDVKVVKTNQVVGGERKKFVLEGEMRCPEDDRTKAKKTAAAAATAEAKP